MAIPLMISATQADQRRTQTRADLEVARIDRKVLVDEAKQADAIRKQRHERYKQAKLELQDQKIMHANGELSSEEFQIHKERVAKLKAAYINAREKLKEIKESKRIARQEIQNKKDAHQQASADFRAVQKDIKTFKKHVL